MRSVDNFRTVEECLIEWLQKDLTRADDYLDLVLESYISDNDFEQLLHSLECIALVRDDIFEVADASDVDKEQLDMLLKENSSPAWERVLEALGYAILEVSRGSVSSL